MGYFVGTIILHHVTEDMWCVREEIFGPALCVKRVNKKSFLGDLHCVGRDGYLHQRIW
jgi:hypothetical protein